MKFNVIGREADVGWGHLALYTGTVIAVAVAFILIVGIATLALGAYGGTDFVNGLQFTAYYAPVFQVLSNLLLPFSFAITAWLLLLLAPVFKIKKDVALCRSLAAAAFIISLVINSMSVVGLRAYLLSTYLHASGLAGFVLEILSGLVSAAMSSILIYLALLLLLTPERKRVMDALVPVSIFALVMILVPSPLLALLNNQADVFWYLVTSLQTYMDPMTLVTFAEYFVFGLVILYHTRKELDMKAAYLFAAISLLGLAFFEAMMYLVVVNWTWSMMLNGVALRLIQLSSLYLLSKRSKD